MSASSPPHTFRKGSSLELDAERFRAEGRGKYTSLCACTKSKGQTFGVLI